MKDVLLITNYFHFECEKSSSRYLTLAEMISEENIDLEIITSSFYHATKKQRDFSQSYLSSFDYKVTLISEPGYNRNISLKRLKSHYIFAKNVLEYLKERKKPDLIYCVVPSLDVADYVTKFAKQKNIPLILDIQDLWPEAFRMAFDIPIVSNILFKPMEKKANKIYSRADKLVAVSNSYLERAKKYNSLAAGIYAYLGIDLERFDILTYQANDSIPKKCIDEIWITYIGTLGHSYNIKATIEALSIVNSIVKDKICLKIIGDGPLKKEFEDFSKLKDCHVDFTGKLSYEDVVLYLKQSDIAINPIVDKSVASIVNKVCDYAAAGLPVVNTQICDEYRALLNEYNAGISCTNNPKDIADQLLYLINNPKIRRIMGDNSRRLAEEKFDRKNTYLKIVNLIK